MKTVRFASLFFLLLFLAACPSAPDGSGLPVDPTAIEYFRENDLAAGWNLGNTLDSHNNGVAGETIWGKPAINQQLLDGVKAQGFNLLRLPITWMGYIGNAPSYTIAPARLARVAEVVDMAHNASLVVIINLHHDGNTKNSTDEPGWLSIKKSLASSTDKAAITAKFRRVWEQIADHFKNYGEWLIFEGFNELHDGNWFWESRVVPKNQYDLVNEWNQVFTDAVRGVGGKNAERLLVIPGYCTGAEALLNSNFKLPSDSSPGRQIVSFHYYRPDNVGLGEGTNRPARSDWGTTADKNAIDRAFQPFKAAFVDRNIPVIIGECGATRQVYTDAAKTAQAHQSRLAYLGHVFGTAKKYGLVPIYWDNGSTGNSRGETFGLFNHNTGEPYGFPGTTEFKECIDAMINAVK